MHYLNIQPILASDQSSVWVKINETCNMFHDVSNTIITTSKKLRILPPTLLLLFERISKVKIVIEYCDQLIGTLSVAIHRF